jgi:GNAT superfamily N-acetyltransferase
MTDAAAPADARVWVAGPEDAAAVTRLMAGFRGWWERDEPTDAQLAAGVERLLADPATEYLLAAPTDAEASGVCQLRYRYGLWYDAEDCWLEDLYVEQSSRRLGLGRALSDAALDRARERGCRRVQLDVNERNPEALALYTALGFDSLQDPPGGRLLLMTRWV